MWLGLVSFLFFASVLAWIVFGIVWVAGFQVNFHGMVEALFGIAILAGFYGVFNASLDPQLPGYMVDVGRMEKEQESFCLCRTKEFNTARELVRDADLPDFDSLKWVAFSRASFLRTNDNPEEKKDIFRTTGLRDLLAKALEIYAPSAGSF